MMQQRARQRASGDIERERASIVLREYAISLVCVACDLIQQSDDGSSGDNRYMVRGVYRVGDSHQLAARYIIIAHKQESISLSRDTCKMRPSLVVSIRSNSSEKCAG